MAKILITGAKGQLGRSLLDAALHFPSHHLVGYDIDQLNVLHPQALYQISKAEKATLLINCAAYTQVDQAEWEPDLAYAVNKEAVQNLVDVCNLLKMTFVHISSDFVFNGKATTPYKESDPPHPISVYGASKLAGELHALSFTQGLVVRTSWLYSPYGNNFVATILRLGSEKQEFTVVNDQTGSPTYAPHLAEALLQMVDQIESNEEPQSLMGLYHYANTGLCSRFDFAQKIKAYVKFGASIVPVPSSAYPTPAQRPAWSVLNTQKITETFGIIPPPWEAGLQTYLACKRI